MYTENMKVKFHKLGFSLVEVLVFVTILGLFFVAAISVSLFSLKNMKFNEHKIMAAHYAEEATEWVTYEKENDWESFITKTGTRCLNASVLSWDETGSCDFTLGTPALFRRTITLTNNGAQVEVGTTVSWFEGSQRKDVTVNTVLNLWE